MHAYYFRIYIPMETWSFQVDIWGCIFTLKATRNFHKPCIKNLALKARALPFYNHSNPNTIVNLSSMGTYTFSELSPFQDTWYYLMVVSSTAIQFNIKVTVFGIYQQNINMYSYQQNILCVKLME